jgi:hypothetical protein
MDSEVPAATALIRQYLGNSSDIDQAEADVARRPPRPAPRVPTVRRLQFCFSATRPMALIRERRVTVTLAG